MILWLSGYPCFITNGSPTISQGYCGAKTPKHIFNDAFAPNRYGFITTPNPISWIHKHCSTTSSKMQEFHPFPKLNIPSAIACGAIVTILVRYRFQNLLLVELTGIIRKQNKTRPCGRFCKSWLGYTDCLARHKMCRLWRIR